MQNINIKLNRRLKEKDHNLELRLEYQMTIGEQQLVELQNEELKQELEHDEFSFHHHDENQLVAF